MSMSLLMHILILGWLSHIGCTGQVEAPPAARARHAASGLSTMTHTLGLLHPPEDLCLGWSAGCRSRNVGPPPHPLLASVVAEGLGTYEFLSRGQPLWDNVVCAQPERTVGVAIKAPQKTGCVIHSPAPVADVQTRTAPTSASHIAERKSFG